MVKKQWATPLPLKEAIQKAFETNYASGLTIKDRDGKTIEMYSYDGKPSPLREFLEVKGGLRVSGYGAKMFHDDSNSDVKIQQNNSAVVPLTQKGWDFLSTMWEGNCLSINTQTFGEGCAEMLPKGFGESFNLKDSRTWTRLSSKTWGTMRSGVLD